jgi:hypothetical protein
MQAMAASGCLQDPGEDAGVIDPDMIRTITSPRSTKEFHAALTSTRLGTVLVCAYCAPTPAGIKNLRPLPVLGMSFSGESEIATRRPRDAGKWFFGLSKSATELQTGCVPCSVSPRISAIL